LEKEPHEKSMDEGVEVVKRYKIYLFLAVFLNIPVSATAGTYSMVFLYTDIPHIIDPCDCPDMPAPLYLATFTDGSSDFFTHFF